MLTLPDSVLDAFKDIRGLETRDAYIANLRSRGWTLSSIAAGAGLSRERVRQIVADNEHADAVAFLPLPLPPAKLEKPKPVYAEPTDQTLTRLKELQPLAQKVRSNMTKYRAEAEEYTSLLNYARTVEGVSLYRLAKLLGVTHGALRFRLVRYGYMSTATGESKAYRPIHTANRAV